MGATDTQAPPDCEHPNRTTLRLPFRGVVLVLGVIVVLELAFWRIPRASRTRSATTKPPADLVPENLDFGAVWRQEAFEWDLPLENRSNRTIAISAVEGSCSCTSVKPKSFSLNPGDRIKLHLTLNLTGKEQGTAFADFSEGLQLFDGGPGSRPLVSWRLQGLVKSPFSLKPTELDFGETLVEGQVYQVRQVDVVCYQPCRRIEVAIDPSFGASTATGDDGTHFRIHIAPNSTLRPGIHESKLLVAAVLKNGDRTPPIPLKVSARILRDIGAIPSFSHAGALKIGSDREDLITLTSRTGRRFTVLKAECNSRTITIEPASGTETGLHAYRLHVHSVALGQQEARLTFQVRVDDKRPKPGTAHDVQVLVPVQYYGIE
jgi:hypothetical protein